MRKLMFCFTLLAPVILISLDISVDKIRRHKYLDFTLQFLSSQEVVLIVLKLIQLLFYLVFSLNLY